MADTIPDVHTSVPTPPPVVNMKYLLFLQQVETLINGLLLLRLNL